MRDCPLKLAISPKGANLFWHTTDGAECDVCWLFAEPYLVAVTVGKSLCVPVDRDSEEDEHTTGVDAIARRDRTGAN